MSRGSSAFTSSASGIRTASGNIPDFAALFESMTDEQLQQFEALIPIQYRQPQNYEDGAVPVLQWLGLETDGSFQVKRNRTVLKERFQKRLENKRAFDDFETTEAMDSADISNHVFGPYRKRLREKLRARLERRVAALRRVQNPVSKKKSQACATAQQTGVFVPSIQTPQFLLSPSSSLSGVAFLSAFGLQEKSAPPVTRRKSIEMLKNTPSKGLIGGAVSSVVNGSSSAGSTSAQSRQPMTFGTNPSSEQQSLSSCIANMRSDNMLMTSTSSSLSTLLATPANMEESGVRLTRRKSTELLKLMLSAADSNLGNMPGLNVTNADLEILNQYSHLREDASVSGLLANMEQM